MSVVYMIGDLHFGHKNIANYRKGFASEEHHREHLSAQWSSIVKKRDVVWVLGDAAFTSEGLASIRLLPGRKILVRGNHDLLSTAEYLSVFEEVYGIIRYKKVWLSHAPIHPDELRGRRNIHGHVHNATIQDARYVNVSAENINYTPAKYQAIQNDTGVIYGT